MNKTSSPTLSPQDISRLLETLSNSRDKAIITLVLETGCYVEDILKLTLEDINHTTHTIQFHQKNTYVHTLSLDTYQALTHWILNRPSTELPHLFITFTHPFRPLTARGIDAMFRKWRDLASIPTLNMQILRRTAKLKSGETIKINPLEHSPKRNLKKSKHKDQTPLFFALYAFVFVYRCIKLFQN